MPFYRAIQKTQESVVKRAFEGCRTAWVALIYVNIRPKRIKIEQNACPCAQIREHKGIFSIPLRVMNFNYKTYFMKKIIFAMTLLAGALCAEAQVRLQPMFSDNMVLQQKTDAPIWGESKPGNTVSVTTSWNKKTYETTADSHGKWCLKVATPKAGGPYTITVNDGKPTTLSNVMVGEVWLCSGQSNMEMSVGQVKDKDKEIADADKYPNIRLFHVQNATSTREQSSLNAVNDGWEVCSSACIERFSACAYFFGKELNKDLNVPIGLIETCWGGTVAEAWTSAGALREMPDFKPIVDGLPLLPESNEERAKLYQEQIADWWKAFRAADKGYADGKAVWADTSVDDSDWQEIKTPGYLQQNGLGGFNGIVWLRKTVDIPESWVGKELTLNLGPIDDEDNTFFNGIEVGHTDGWMAGRNYKIPADLVKQGKAVVTIRITDGGGNGGCWGGTDNFNIACGNDKMDISGMWKYNVAVDIRRFTAMPMNTANNANIPSVLFNAMLKPLVPYSIKGAIWYQGESNAPLAYQYRELLPVMITDWRTRWGYDFPFYIVQLANYMPRKDEPTESSWAELREAQVMATRLKNTQLACIIDIGEANDIHPKNKQEVGRRLALVAEANNYGKKVTWEGPMYEGYRMEGNAFRINFRGTDGGLKTSDGKALRTFQIAGPDHKFVWADATIEGNTVVVSSPKVKLPVAVRYGWADNPDCNLCNGAGLPASPFRTDDWKGITLLK